MRRVQCYRFDKYINKLVSVCIILNKWRFILQWYFFFFTVSRTQQGRQREPFRILRRGQEALRKSTPRFASTLERRNENINVNKYFTSSIGDRTHNQSILHTLCLCARTGLYNVRWVLPLSSQCLQNLMKSGKGVS